jgi:hypothetical protein
VGVGVLGGREGVIVIRTAVHHPVRVDKRESPGELLCEGANLVLSEALAFAFNEKIEESVGLGCAVATFSTPLCRGHGCTVLSHDKMGRTVCKRCKPLHRGPITSSS